MPKFTFSIVSEIEERVAIEADSKEEAWEELDNGYQADQTINHGEVRRQLVKIGRKNIIPEDE
jgi:hypothetical protein